MVDRQRNVAVADPMNVSINFRRWKSRLRDALSGDSPQLHIALLYGACTGFMAATSLGLLASPPMISGGPPVIRALIPVPREWANVLMLACFSAAAPAGGLCGWAIGGFIDRLSRTRRTQAALLLFPVMFLPGACIVVSFMPFSKEVLTPLYGLGELAIVCAIACFVYWIAVGRSGHGGGRPRGS